MNKLFVVNDTAALNGGAATPQDISKMADGSIGFYHTSDPSTWLSAKPTKDFTIVAGEGDNNQATTMNVAIANLETQYIPYADAVKGSYAIIVPTPVEGKEYSLSIIKANAVQTERYQYNFNEQAKASTADEAKRIAKSIGNQVKTFFYNRRIDGTVTVVDATITITISETHDDFKVIAADELYYVTPTVTEQKSAVGDNAYVLDLAKKYAANDGYDFTDPQYSYIYQGYLKNVTGTKYDIFVLRFKNERGASHTSAPELPYQTVTIAVDENSPALKTINTIFGVASTTSTSGQG